MFISVIDKNNVAAWDNDTLFYDGSFYAMFNLTRKIDDTRYQSGYYVDLYRSEDGVHWNRILEEALYIEGAHAGYSFHRFGNLFVYHPTCTTPDKGIHFKTYCSEDMLHWKHMGDEYDVFPDPAYYAMRWDEIIVMDDIDELGNVLYYGYISAEVLSDIGPPSCGLLKSYDGLKWDVLPPPYIEWGRIPPHHMEVNFCEKIGDRYYLSLSGRLYMDNMGYSLYTFVGDSPQGPFYPDESQFRLCGSTNKDISYLSHSLWSPYGLLCATWLSSEIQSDIPSPSFALAPLKRLCCEDGHLFLSYWEGNEQAKGNELPQIMPFILHPQKTSQYTNYELSKNHMHLKAGRDGLIAMIADTLNPSVGWIMECQVTLTENRTQIETHHHAALCGIFFEQDSSVSTSMGTTMVISTQGGCLTGDLAYSEDIIAEYAFYDDRNAAYGLHTSRSGAFQGHLRFDQRDHIHPIGSASAPRLRHKGIHNLRVLMRGNYFELYVDDAFVQSWALFDFTGRVGFVVCDGIADVWGVHFYSMCIDL